LIGEKSFIGSFNFDPRSVLWNTEVGVLVDSPELAEHVRNLALQGMAPALSYEAKLQDGQVVWVTEDNGQLHTLTREPGSWWRRFNAWFSHHCGPGAHACKHHQNPIWEHFQVRPAARRQTPLGATTESPAPRPPPPLTMATHAR
jgi:phosphatidylserine/phosphatidylglycerophosphate/cardiolipin synthase-like enzyme